MGRQERADEPADASRPHRGYHHGDVRAAAVAAASAHLQRSGLADFTLRSIARDLAIAHPSLYNHFRNRDALVDAVAVSGFRRLSGQIDELLSVADDPVGGIRAVGHAIIDFAREQPGLYRLMFGADLVRRKGGDVRLAAAMEAPLRSVASAVERSSAEGRLRPGDPLLVAAALWATAHGLAMLVIDQRLELLGPGQEQVLIASSIDATLAGFAPPRHGSG